MATPLSDSSPSPLSAQSPFKTIAVVGLGTMGSGLASRLLDQGIQVRVWNRTPERAEPLARAGAFAASRPSEAVEGTSAAICTVADGDALSTVLHGPDGILARGGYPGALICASTVAPDEVVRLAGDAPSVLDVGMLGNRDHARDGDQVVRAGGKLAALGEQVDIPAHLGLVVDWWVVGPFDAPGTSGFAKVFPPERSQDLAARYTGQEGREITWRRHRTADPLGLGLDQRG